ncbi:hypothetical protein KJ782_03300 [Patescibacteria group bacterium]|nr:hypothetical protein [Patescibacteria group bacterium]
MEDSTMAVQAVASATTGPEMPEESLLVGEVSKHYPRPTASVVHPNASGAVIQFGDLVKFGPHPRDATRKTTSVLAISMQRDRTPIFEAGESNGPFAIKNGLAKVKEGTPVRVIRLQGWTLIGTVLKSISSNRPGSQIKGVQVVLHEGQDLSAREEVLLRPLSAGLIPFVTTLTEAALTRCEDAVTPADVPAGFVFNISIPPSPRSFTKGTPLYRRNPVEA